MEVKSRKKIVLISSLKINEINLFYFSCAFVFLLNHFYYAAHLESLEEENREKSEKVNKFKSVAIKAKKEIDSIKGKVIILMIIMFRFV